MALIKCQACGADVSDSTSFCIKCGAALAGSAAAPAPAGVSGAGAGGGGAEELSLFGYYVKCLKNYAAFDGRARRKEYWGFYLFNMIFMLGLAFAGGLTGGLIGGFMGDASGSLGSVLGLALYYLYAFGTLIPSLAVLWRRFHDTSRSGFYFLWGFLPIVGAILILIATLRDSHGDNGYGRSPKYPDSL